MHKVIDTPWNTTGVVQALAAAGVQTVIRYFNHANSKTLPEKRLELAEAQAIHDAGMSIAVVFQQRGGAQGQISDLDLSSAKTDATRALKLAEDLGMPKGAAIYFAVDHDYVKTAHLDVITAYFGEIRAVFKGAYRIGVYGSGLLGKTVRDAGFADFIWLAAAKGWAGTRTMLTTDQWALYQIWPPVLAPINHDGNTISAAWPNYGQFRLKGSKAQLRQTEEQQVGAPETDEDDAVIVRAPQTVLMEVTARSGLKVRRGPDTSFVSDRALPNGTIVHALGKTGDWVQIDIEGDGAADGYMHGNFLRVVSGGLDLTPQEVQTVTGGSGVGDPYAIAKAEMALGVAEVPGPGNNPRIVKYHNSTGAMSAAASHDSVPWCSSFVNYCVEKAGMEGTNSQWALNWANWGADVSGAPRIGDIVVFERVGKGGHVGFFVADLGTHISVLGGNQSDRVKISAYPKDGKLGSNVYRLRAIRRG